jgi:hypothetical protein
MKLEEIIMKKIIAASTFLGLLSSFISPVYADVTIAISPPANLKILDFGTAISGGIGIILAMSGLVTFIYLLWGGFEWIISGGDKGKVEAAQHRIQAALLGLFIVFAAWAVMLILQNILGFTIFGPGGFTLPTLYKPT